jgi:hypothetical protein
MSVDVSMDPRMQHAYARFVDSGEFPATLVNRVTFIAAWRACEAARLATWCPRCETWLDTDHDDELPR